MHSTSLTRALERLMASPWMGASRLAHLALALWLLSLFMVVQVGTEDPPRLERLTRGYEVLGIGWFLWQYTAFWAWFSYPLFLLAYGRTVWSSGRPPVLVAALTVVLGMTTLWIPYSRPYGFAWGMVVWMLALWLMLAAAASKGLAQRQAPIDRHAMRAALAGLALVVFGSLALALGQRLLANTTERARLQWPIVFKRAPVCTVEPRILHTYPLVSGVLELQPLSGIGPVPLALQDVRNLLRRGAPVVRLHEYDYSLYRAPGAGHEPWLLRAAPAQGEADVLLQASEGEDGTIAMRLSERASGRVLLNEYWPGRLRTQCQRANVDLMQTLAKTLYLRPPRFEVDRTLPSYGSSVGNPPVLEGRIEAYWPSRVSTQGGPAPARPAPVPEPARPADRPDSPARRNTQCPAGIGFRDVALGLPRNVSANLHTPLAMGDVLYHVNEHAIHTQLWCLDDAIYLYQIGSANMVTNPSLSIRMEKRELPSLRRVWRGEVQVQDKRLAEQSEHAALTGLWETAEGPVMQLHIASTGVQVHIAAPWRKRPASDVERPAPGARRPALSVER